MRLNRAGAGLAGVLLALLTRPATADLDSHIVRVYRGRPPSAATIGVNGNAGVYLGDGLVLTAAHVAGKPDDRTPLGIVAGDRLIPARFVKAGRFEETDISLLAVDPASLPAGLATLPRVDLCVGRLEPGHSVAVASAGRVNWSTIISHSTMPPGVPAELDSLIKDVYSTGESGSAVFDPITLCLAGIVSRRIEILPEKGSGKAPIGLAKYFVPADEISAFLGPSFPRP